MPGRPPRRRHPGTVRWLAALAGFVATVLGLALLAVAMRPASSVADARGAALRLSGPAATAYPWSAPTPGAADPWGFVQGQCTSYVAWWLNTHGVPFAKRTRGPAGTGQFGDAGTWDAGARSAGFAVSSTPRVGTVAQWHAGSCPRPPAAPAQRS